MVQNGIYVTPNQVVANKNRKSKIDEQLEFIKDSICKIKEVNFKLIYDSYVAYTKFHGELAKFDPNVYFSYKDIIYIKFLDELIEIWESDKENIKSIHLHYLPIEYMQDAKAYEKKMIESKKYHNKKNASETIDLLEKRIVKYQKEIENLKKEMEEGDE